MKKNKKTGRFENPHRYFGIKLLLTTVALGATLQFLYTYPDDGIMYSPLIKEVHAQAPTINPAPAYTVDSIVDAIHMLESSRGTTGKPGSLQKYCEDHGGWNQLGYGGMALKICFKNKEEGMTRVTEWVNKHYAKLGNSLPRTLCMYNLGKDVSDCTYYQNYLKVK